MKKLLFLVMMMVDPLVLNAQNGIIGSGFTAGWTTDADNEYFSEAPIGSGRILTDVANGTGNQYFRLLKAWNSDDNTQYGPLNDTDTEISFGSKITDIHETTNGAWYTNVTSVSDNYIIRTAAAGDPPSPMEFVVFRIQGDVQTISSHASPGTITSGDAATINLTTSGTSSGQGFYLVYSDDDFSTTSILEMTGSDSSYSVDISADVNTSGKTIEYYFISSGSGLIIETTDVDLFTISLLNNSNNNYSYSTTSPAPDTAPTLLTLADNATDASIYPTFTWESVTNATKYRIQVSTVTDFSTTVVDDTTAGLTYTVSTALAANTELYWRVRGQSTEGVGPFATFRTFTTGSGVFTVYYSNPNEWTDVYIHYWGGAEGTSWPGLTMTAPEGGSPWYSYDVPEDVTNMLFHNNDGSQTLDLTRSTTGYFNGSDWSDTDPFILSTGPTLTSPSDEATDIGVNTTLTWDALENATAYIVVVDDNNDFASPLDSTVATSPFDPTGDLAYSTTYYWKVRGNNYAGNSDWTYASFTTEAQANGLSIADGDWSSTSIWSNGVVPANIDVTISHSVVLDQNATVSNITIEDDKTLNGSSNTLSIEDGGIFTNNGTFTYSTSTVHFLGDGSVAGSSTSEFYNLIIDGSDDDSDYGGTYIPNTSTINRLLTIATGGYLASSNGGDGITTNAELPDYASGAGLAINGPFTVSSYASGWGDSGSKLPENVNLGASGNVELTTLARTVSGLLTVQGNNVTTGGNLTILSGGSVDVSGTISGNITFELEITGTQGWRTLAAPVSSTTVSDVMSGLWSQGFTGASTTEGNANVRTYNGSAYVAPSNATDAIAAGTGYAALIFADDNFEGEVEGFPKTISATGTLVTADVDVTLNQGLDVLTLVGNPYLATLDADLLNSTNLYGTVYSYSNSEGEFISWNGSTGSLTDGLIAPFQSFFVANNSADASTLTIPTSATEIQILEKERSKPGLITFKSTMGDLKSSAYLSFTDAGLEVNDNFDALKLAPLDVKSYLSISTFNGQSYLDINNLPAELNRSLEILLFVTANQPVNGNWIPLDGEVTLSWPQVSAISESWNVELIDNLTSEIINMLDQSDYTFSLISNPSKKVISKDLTPSMITSDGSARFTIKVGPMTTSAESGFGLPTEIALNQNYPNPFNPGTQISFALPQAMHVTVKVFDMLGREVATLLNNSANAGITTIQYNASNLSSGMYYYRLQAGETSITKKMMLLK